jgi:hypothetical protein
VLVRLKAWGLPRGEQTSRRSSRDRQWAYKEEKKKKKKKKGRKIECIAGGRGLAPTSLRMTI